ncbi:MAG: hypothetical protein ACJAZX_001005 [Rickettsiales bacterium]|jgi:hypothetical protein
MEINREIGMIISKSQGRINIKRLKKSRIETPFSVIKTISETALENQISKTRMVAMTRKEEAILRMR